MNILRPIFAHKIGKLVLILAFSAVCVDLFAQFQVNGSAIKTADRCWTLTPDEFSRVGSIWYDKKLDLRESFDLTLDVFLGCRNNDGADGVVFALQPVSTSIGVVGGGLGIGGVRPSLALEMDTWQNSDAGDPSFDHLALIKNGDVNHFNAQNTLVGPLGFKIRNIPVDNIEDCKFHELRVKWDANQQKLTAFWDCDSILAYKGNIVADVFQNDPLVFWGFTASTGGARNEQKICLRYTSLLDEIPDTTICQDGQIQLRANGGVRYAWSPITGLSDPNIANPIARPPQTTTYTVAITDTCGRRFVDTVTVKVGGNPFVLELGADTILCKGQSYYLYPNIPGANFRWQDGKTDSVYIARQTGTYTVNVEKNFCKAVDSVRVRFVAPPEINLGSSFALCDDQKVILNAEAEDAVYRWQDGSNTKDYVVNKTGLYQVTVSNRCGTMSGSVYALLYDCRQIFVPTAFSPNGDGQNDNLQVYSNADIAVIKSFLVFDRWGRLVYEAQNFKPNDPSVFWNGGNEAGGVYVWTAEIVFSDGLILVKKGDVTLMR